MNGGPLHRAPTPIVVLVACLLAVSSCTGGDDRAGASQRLTALLEIITTNIQSDIEGAGFAEAEEGQELTVGDRVRTDDTGFAELAYHDGSWQRVENNATLTVEDLAESSEGSAVRTSVDIGRTWNRVRSLAEPEDAYELETPVATASVRGTVFSTDCPTADFCEFRVYEGTVVITTPDGQEVVMEAPSTLGVRAGEPLGEPEVVPPDVLRRDPWAEKNLGRDREKLAELGEDGETTGGEGGEGEEARALPTPAQLRTASLEGTYDADRVGVRSNYLPTHPNHVAAGSSSDRSYEVTTVCDGDDCTLGIAVDGGQPEPMEFDGRTYLQVEEFVIGCTDPATGTTVSDAAARLEVSVRWRPVRAERRDGEWIVTSFRGTARYATEVLDPAALDDERCYWPTTDGAPPDQLVNAIADRR